MISRRFVFILNFDKLFFVKICICYCFSHSDVACVDLGALDKTTSHILFFPNFMDFIFIGLNISIIPALTLLLYLVKNKVHFFLPMLGHHPR